MFRAWFRVWFKGMCSFGVALNVCPVEVQNLNVTRDQFSSKDEMFEFFEIFNNCQHNQAEGLYIKKSMAAYRNWINKMRHLQTASNQTKYQEIESMFENICEKYRENELSASQIDDIYWKYYKSLRIPNRSMNCAIFGVNRLVEFILLPEYEKDKSKQKSIDILDIGCGTGLVGISLIKSLNHYGLDKYFNINIEGFDHSDVALEYGKNEKYWNYLSKYNKVWKHDLLDSNQNNLKYDVVIASDLLYQYPACGCIGINAVKNAFDYVNSNGGYLVIINPVQISPPCMQESYQKILEKEFYLENNIVCLLDEIIDTIDHNSVNQRLDAVYVHIRILYKGMDKTVHDNNCCEVRRPCVNLMR